MNNARIEEIVVNFANLILNQRYTICYCVKPKKEDGSIGETPAEKAGIKLEIGQNKIETLIKMASKKRN